MIPKRLTPMPIEIKAATVRGIKSVWGVKYAPREPKGVERLLELRRPRISSGGVWIYERGDIMPLPGSGYAVVVVAGIPFQGKSGYMTYWLQYAVVRAATADDIASVETAIREKEEKDAAARRVF